MNRTAKFPVLQAAASAAAIAIAGALLAPVVAHARISAGTDLDSVRDLSTAIGLYHQDYDSPPGGEGRHVDPPPTALSAYVRGAGFARTMAAARATSVNDCVAADPTGVWVDAGGGCMDTKTGLVWSASRRLQTGLGSTYPQAQAYCQGLNTTTGYTGWRLGALSEHQGGYADGGAGYIDNPSRYVEWTGTTYPGKGAYRGLTYAYMFDWSNGTWTAGLIQDKYGTYSYSDAICVRPGP